MSAYVMDQEAWLSEFAEYVGINRDYLGHEAIRFALAAYHTMYLPVAAVVEKRIVTKDILDTYRKFGYEPNVPSYSTSSLVVTVPNAPTVTPYVLEAGVVGIQDGLRFITQSELVIALGQTSSNLVPVVSRTLGLLGTLKNGSAILTRSVGWLRGASISLTNTLGGKDGSTIDEIAREFGVFATKPKSLVEDSDHTFYVSEKFPEFGRVITIPRAQVIWTGSDYQAEIPKAGYITVAATYLDGVTPGEAKLREVADSLLDVSVPYGGTTLEGEIRINTIPIRIAQIEGVVEIVKQIGADDLVLKNAIANALNTYLDWRTWDTRRATVIAGELWGVIAKVEGVAYVQKVYFTNIAANQESYQLKAWELPISGFTPATIFIKGVL